MSELKTIDLYFREGGSDKVYMVAIEQEGSGYVVNFQYGRRGSTLVTGSKTDRPVSYDKALAVFGKLVNEKMKKGYKEATNGKAVSMANPVVARETGVKPMLLNEIDEKDIDKYINDPDWCAQEKYDGVRRMLIKTGNDVVGTNRKGLSIPLSKDIIQQLQNTLPQRNYILDGEAIGDSVVIFDYPVFEVPFKARYQALLDDFRFDGVNLKLAPVAWTKEEKRALLTRLKKENAEGIVFKNIHSNYVPGRPNSGGDQLKFKFVATATCMVTGGNLAGTSVSLAVFDGNKEIPVGNATVYPNMKTPKPGAIVEVRYLYYFPGGSLFQPVLLGEREDMGKEDCTLKQLKHKREEEIIL